MDSIVNFLFVFFNGDFFVFIVIAVILFLLSILIALLEGRYQSKRKDEVVVNLVGKPNCGVETVECANIVVEANFLAQVGV